MDNYPDQLIRTWSKRKKLRLVKVFNINVIYFSRAAVNLIFDFDSC